MISRQSAELDGGSVTVTFGKAEIRCVKASYGDKLNKEKVREMGGQTISGITPGIYDTDEVKITMTAKRFRSEFMPAVTKNGFGNQKLAIVVGRSSATGDRDSDLLRSCQCTNLGAAVDATAKGEDAELAFMTEQIFWTSDRKTLNTLDTPVLAPGLSGSL